MGFDNECILNIQSLAGEYFCPVCRLLVYPNEALQSQCTHLYCKPCLTYIVSTTQACPYDGFLVTEADSKPLVESNKSLAESIGKITVHCLFHRSGCTWQGALSDCTSHCSGCAFGNSPVVCNRCGIQIVHRQVQEHAQNCPGVQPQASQPEGVLDAAATGAATTGDQTQAVTQAGVTSQGHTQTTVAPPPAVQQPSSQPQAVVQAAVPPADQWHQYYQQYHGYNPYQQHYQQYYPYQQQHLQLQPQGYVQPQPQPQPQIQPQPQVQPQIQPQPQVQPPAQSQPQLQPLHPPVQGPVATQPQNQAQVNQQQQSHPLHHGQPLPQPQAYPYAQPQSYPQAPPHPQPQPIQPHPQNMQMPQYQQPQTQMQHTQPQIQQPLSQPQLQSQPHLQTQPQTQLQHHPQALSQPKLHPSLLNQPQAQHTAANAVTGHHSYQQPQPHQQMPLSGPPQPSMYVHPHAAAQSQMQNQFTQQPPSTRPPQSHAAISNQQQSVLLPSLGQAANIPPAQQLPVRPHAHQPGVPVSQHPVMQPIQQPMPHQFVQQLQPFAGKYQQGPFAQQQLPVQSQLRPLGPPHPFQQNPQAYLQPQQSALMHAMQTHQPQNLGQPTTPNHGLQSQPYQSATGQQGRPVQFGANQPPSNKSNVSWTNNQVQLSSEQQSGVASKPTMFDKQEIADKSVDEREAEYCEKTTTTDNLDAKGSVEGDIGGVKVPKSETDVKSVVDEIKTKVEEKTNAIDTSAEEFVTNPESHAAENAEPVNKMVKEEVIENVEDQKDSAKDDYKQEEPSSYKNGPQLGAQSEKLQKEKNLPQAKGAPQGSGAVPPAGQVEAGRFMQSPPSLGGSSTLQQRPSAPLMFQAPIPAAVNQMQAPGHPSTQFRPSAVKPHGPEIPPGGMPVSGTAASLGRGTGQPVPHLHSFELPSVAPHGPYNQGHLRPHMGANRISHGDSVGGLPLHSLPPTAFPAHGRMMAGGAAYGPEGQMGQKQPTNPMEAEMFASQRPGYMDGRGPESHFPGALERSPLGQPSIMRMNGIPGPELRDERFKSFPDEHLNPFPMDPARHVIDQGEFEEDLKQFSRPSHLDAEPVAKLGSHFPPRPFDRDPHGFGMDMGPRPFERGLNYDPGLKMDPIGGLATSRFLPSYHDDAAGRSDSSHAHPDFAGPGPTYGRRHMDGLSPRSPFRNYPGISSHGFGGLPGSLGSSGSGRDDVDGREFRRFGDPVGNSFHDSRFPVLPSHLRRDEFEGPGQDFLPGHLRRGEFLGPHDLRLGETAGFGGFPGYARMGDLGGPGNFPHPRLGEPGFRSSFSRWDFPNDGGIFTGDVEPFDNSRKRKPLSMGWCRICKVDCETVDGLDLHSQTREHQKMAMDMVISIKQNAKKQKLTSNDRGSTDDTIKSRNVNFEVRGKKH